MKNSGKMKYKTCGKTAISKGSPGNNQDGVALVTALLTMTLISLLTIVSVNLSVTDANRTKSYKESRDAFYIADAGIEHAKSVIGTLTFDTLLAAAGILDLDDGDANVNFNGGSYSVVVTDNNDGDGDTTNDSDGVVVITSTATTAGGTTKTIVAMVKKYHLESEDFPAAVTLADIDSEIDLNSNAFLIQGNGSYRDLVGPPPDKPKDDPACADKNGIATNDNLPDKIYQNPNFVDNIQGVGGIGDVATGDTTFTLARLQDMRDMFLSLPKVTYSGSQSNFSGNIGSRANPQITYFNDSVTITGNLEGAGVLIIDRDFKVEGNFIFEGIVLIGICDTCPGRFETGSGNSIIYGAVVEANPTSSFDDESRIKMTGNASLYYSCQAIDDSLKNILNNTFSVISWSG